MPRSRATTSSTRTTTTSASPSARRKGLVVPVLRDADTLDFAGIEKGIGELGRKARDGKLSIADLTGGTFTITNGGVFGSLMSTPILNPPQSAILGMHKIQQRPMVVGGEIKVRPMMYLALSYDHRIIDGREAVLFLVRVKECIEDPERLLLGDLTPTVPSVASLDDRSSLDAAERGSHGERTFDLVVIGAGPGGYVAAIRAAQLGMKVAVVEKRATFGGTCLNVGCIPSKALLQSSHLFEQAGHDLAVHGIMVGTADARFRPAHEAQGRGRRSHDQGRRLPVQEEQDHLVPGHRPHRARRARSRCSATTARSRTRSTAKNILIASGSEVTPLPGVTVDEKKIVSSTGALELAEVPKHLVVVGAGIIGLELGSVWRRLGSEVTVIEFLDRITPGVDDEITKHLPARARQAGPEVQARHEGDQGGGIGRRRHADASSRPRAARPRPCRPTSCWSASAGGPTSKASASTRRA